MASARSVIELAIIGSTRGLTAAAAEARAMAERIAAAEDQVSAARLRQENANRQVAQAEARLNEARARAGNAAAAVATAEDRVGRARAASLGSATRLGEAEQRLEQLRANGGSAQEIARAEQAIQRARAAAEADTRRVEEAEARLNRARTSAQASAERIRSFEEALARARNNQFRASEALAQAEARLAATRRRGTDDLNRQRDGILGVFDAFQGLIQAFSGADGVSTSLLAKLGALNSVISSIGGPIAQLVVGLAEFVVIANLAVEVIGVIGGLIGQAFAGVPALLLAVAAAAGTVLIGMKGISAAAKVMEPAFKRLQTAVSDTFQRGLTPAFKQLASILPQLTPRFQGIAQALSDMAGNSIKLLTTAHAVGQLNQILAGTAGFVKGLSGGIAQFLDGLVAAAAAAAPAFQQLGTAIGNIFGQIGQVFSRLAADGTIQRAVAGLAATIQGLADVAAPLVELFIRMGAALGASLGTALTRIGGGIQQVIPFFEHLAQVAGTILVDAFNQLGPPISQLVDSILPGANAGLDGLAAIMHDVVLPAIAGFINFLRTDGIPGIVNFTKGAILQFLEFASSVTSTMSVVLGSLSSFFRVMAAANASNPLGKMFLDAATGAENAKRSIDGATASIDAAKSKVITFTADVPSGPLVGEQGVLGVTAAINAAHDKTVTTTANVPSGPTQGTLGNQVLEGAIGAVINKSVTTTSQVPGTPVLGTQGNQALSGAIGNVGSKTVTTTGNVPENDTLGKRGNQLLKGAIDNVLGKIVAVIANVTGLNLVNDLFGAIDRLKDKVVNVIANVIGAGASFLGHASGGRVSNTGVFLVGENGPELLTLDALGGRVTPAARTAQVLSERRAQNTSTALIGGSPAPTADQPITINVMLSAERIAELARVEIKNNDRATKRVVLAGSGTTF